MVSSEIVTTKPSELVHERLEALILIAGFCIPSSYVFLMNSYDYLICNGPEGTDFTVADGQELRMLRPSIFQTVSQNKRE